MPDLLGPTAKYRGRQVAREPLEVRWKSSGDITTYINSPVAFSIDTVSTHTVTREEDSTGGGDGFRARFSGTGTGSQGSSTRIVYPVAGTSSVDSEVLSLIAEQTYDTGTAYGQMGNIHRLRLNGDSTAECYIVWHDITFAQNHIINADIWHRDATGTGGGFSSAYSGVANANRTLTGLAWTWPVIASSRSSNTVTLTVPVVDGNRDDHRTQVGDKIKIVGTDFDSGSVAVTAVTTSSIQYTLSGSDSLAGGAGYLMNFRRTMPYFLNSVLEGQVLYIRAWRPDQSVPSWGDGRFSWVRDLTSGSNTYSTKGESGIYAGHVKASTLVEHGPVYVWDRDVS